MTNYTQRFLAITISLILVAGVTPAFADPANLGNPKLSPGSINSKTNDAPFAPGAFLPLSDFTASANLTINGTDFYSFDATSVGAAPGDPFVAVTDNDIGGPNPDTILGTFANAAFNVTLDTDDDNSPLGDGLGSAIGGVVNPDGFIYLGVTGFPDFGFVGIHPQSGPYDLSVVVGFNDNNNFLDEAELVDPSLFTSPEPVNVTQRAGSVTATINGTGGFDDVDYYEFTFCNEDTSFIADIDNDPFTFDTILSLFVSNGTLIAWDDDTALDDGSASSLDSFIGQITLQPGTYFVAVSQFANFANTTFSCSNSTSLDIGGQEVSGCTPGDSSFDDHGPEVGLPYNLHLSLQGGELSCDVVGGEFLPIDSTALLLAGAQTNAVWIMSALAVIGSIAFGALYLTRKRD